MLSLYSYFRSSASYRVRIALHWKDIEFEYVPVHLTKGGGEQHSETYRKINPMGHVPALVHDDFVVVESMAIIDYLDRIFPQNHLFPAKPRERALVMQVCELINSGIQPLQNVKVGQFLGSRFGLNKAQCEDWTKHWIGQGLLSLEKILEQTSGQFCVGDHVTAADCFLIPQCVSSRRFGVDTSVFPMISKIEKNAAGLSAFQKAHPENQPDYEP